MFFVLLTFATGHFNSKASSSISNRVVLKNNCDNGGKQPHTLISQFLFLYVIECCLYNFIYKRTRILIKKNQGKRVVQTKTTTQTTGKQGRKKYRVIQKDAINDTRSQLFEDPTVTTGESEVPSEAINDRIITCFSI